MAINLGDISFGLGPDTRRLAEARRLIVQFGADVDRIASSQSKGARAIEAAMRRQEMAMVSASQAAANLNAKIRNIGGSESLINKVNAAFEKFTAETSKGTQSALQFQRSQEELRVELATVNRQLMEEAAIMKELASIEKAATDKMVANWKRITEQVAAADKEMTASQKAATQQIVDAWKRETDQVLAEYKQQEAAAKASNAAIAETWSRVTTQVAAAARDQERYILQIEKAYFDAERAVKAFQASAANLKTPNSLGMRAGAAESTYRTNFAAAGADPVAQMRATQAFRKELQLLQLELNKTRKAEEDLGHSELAGGLRRLADVAVLVQGPMSGLATRLALISSVAGSVSLSMAAMVVGISAGVGAFVELAKASIEANRTVTQVSMALTSLSGNTTIAQVEMANLMKWSDQVGVSFVTLAKEYAQLEAASKGTNLEGEHTWTLFQQITAAGAKMALSQDDIAGAVKAVQQMMSKGVIQAEELRGQLGDRIPGAFNIMADALGVTTKKLGEMMKKGQIGSEALVKFGNQLALVYGVDLSKSIDSVTAAEGRLSNALLRFFDSLDKTVGFSDAYKSALDTLVSVLDYFTNHMAGLVDILGAIAGAIVGALAAIYAPAVLAGFTVVIEAVKTLTAAMIAFDVATLANPFGAIARILIQLGVAIAGAVAGYELMDKVIGDVASAHIGALPAVKAYIQAQQNMKYSIRDTTEEYIKQQEVFAAGLALQADEIHRQIADEQAAVANLQGRYDSLKNTRAAAPLQSELTTATGKLTLYNGQLRTVTAQQQEAALTTQKLRDILAKQTKAEDDRTKALNAGTAAQIKHSDTQRKALDTADDEIRKTQELLAIMALPKAQQGFAKVQMDINEAIDNFRDKLVNAKVPLDEINQRVATYTDLITKLKVGEFNIDTQIKAWDALATTMSSGMQSASDNLVDSLLNGESAMDSLKNSAKDVVGSILKYFLQLTAINPLLNSIFQGDPSTGKPFPVLSGFNFGSLFGSTPFVPNTTLGGFLGLAGGTPNFKGGMAWVGEDGPERMYVPPGARVKPSNRSGGRGSGGGELRVVVVPNDERFNAYVDQRSDAVSKQNDVKAYAVGMQHYGDTLFHDHFENHVQNRRHRGGRKALNMGV